MSRDGSLESQRVLWFAASPDEVFEIANATEDLWGDPQFINWKKYDYRLKNTSPAYDFDPALGVPIKDAALHDHLSKFEIVPVPGDE